MFTVDVKQQCNNNKFLRTCMFCIKLQNKTNQKKTKQRIRIGSYYSGDYIVRDRIYTDITACNIEEPHQKHRLGTVCNILLEVGVGAREYFYWIQVPNATYKTDAHFMLFNPIALRKAKIVYNFGLSECNRVQVFFELNSKSLSL